MKRNVLQTIENGVNGFSKGQKRIAAYILNNYDKAAYMTAAKLGQLTEVSESTVVRFAAEMGYEGYPEMQKALQAIVRSKMTSLQRMQVTHEQLGSRDILSGVMQRDADSIRNAVEQIDRGQFTEAVDKLMSAEHIYIMGVRSSAFLAGYLNFYFHLLFPNVIYVQNSAAGEIYEQTIHIGPGDVLLAISFPRYSVMAIHAVQVAHEKGATIIAITDSQMSPLYKLAAVSLLVKCDAISFVDSMAAPLSLLNALILEVGRRKPQEVAATYGEMEQLWSRYSIFGKTEDE